MAIALADLDYLAERSGKATVGIAGGEGRGWEGGGSPRGRDSSRPHLTLAFLPPYRAIKIHNAGHTPLFVTVVKYAPLCCAKM